MAAKSGMRSNKRAARWIVAVAIAATSVVSIAGSAHAAEQTNGQNGQNGQNVSASTPRPVMHSLGIRW